MSDQRPVMVGYLVQPLAASTRQDQQAEEHLHAFAERLGHRLTRVFRDQRHGRPCAASAMLAYARSHEVNAVALVVGNDLAAQHQSELGTAGIRVVTIAPPLQRAGG